MTAFLIIFILSPISYLYISLSNDYKRTDYPGKEISSLVQRRWDKNFKIDFNCSWYERMLVTYLTISSRPT